MNSCILCGKKAISDLDNACESCITDLARIDAKELPDWLFLIHAQQSVNYIKEIMRE